MNSLRLIMISGYFGFGNCGDEAILSAMIREFSQFIPRTKMIILSQDPCRTRILYQVNSINRLNPFQIIAKMMKTSIFISGGGGLLQDVSGKGFGIIYYLSLLILARLFHIPSVIYAQGIGPVEKHFNKKIMRWVLNRVNLIMVRDQQSKELLQKLGIRNQSISVYADPSFLLPKKEVPLSIKEKYQLDQCRDASTREINIGLAIRNCKEIGKDYESKITQFAGIADYLIEKYQANLFFLPFQRHTDLPFMEDVIKKMKQPSVKCIKEDLSPDQILSLFSELSLIIGMRFHAILFATMTNKPFIAIAYDPKVEHYVHSLGISELLINLSELTVKIVDNKLKYIEANQKMIQYKLKKEKERYERKASANVQRLFQFIEEKCIRKESTHH